MTRPSGKTVECLAPGPLGPGVPLSVWPGPAALGGLPCGGPITAAVAGQVVESFSHPGDLAGVDGGCPPIAAGAVLAGRRLGGPPARPAAGSGRGDPV
jgi:hypothetical protein